jgi:hypothetical protein
MVGKHRSGPPTMRSGSPGSATSTWPIRRQYSARLYRRRHPPTRSTQAKWCSMRSRPSRGPTLRPAVYRRIRSGLGSSVEPAADLYSPSMPTPIRALRRSRTASREQMPARGEHGCANGGRPVARPARMKGVARAAGNLSCSAPRVSYPCRTANARSDPRLWRSPCPAREGTPVRDRILYGARQTRAGAARPASREHTP